MDIELRSVHRLATSYDVTRAVAGVLHSQSFVRGHCPEQSRPVNFQVVLKPDTVPNSIRNGGVGTLTLPDVQLGHDFLAFLRKRGAIVKVLGRKIHFAPSPTVPGRRLQDTLAKVCCFCRFVK